MPGLQERALKAEVERRLKRLAERERIEGFMGEVQERLKETNRALQTPNDEMNAALERLGLLSGGLLPICANCKKIRDNGKWEALEHYFKVHAGVDFTHGIRPECKERFFPRA